MRTAILSDLHLGLVAGGDVLRDPETRELLLERLAQSLLYASDEKAEGASAFLEKRPARFRDDD